MKNYVKTFEQFIASKLNESEVPNRPTGDSIKSSADAFRALIKDSEVKTLKFIKDAPYEKVIETKKKIAPAVSFSERGGDAAYSGQNINVDDTTFKKDSEEIEKKFQWVKRKIEKLTPKEFSERLSAIQDEFSKRFADSELVENNDYLEYSHKFLQNDNIAQRDYITADGKTIKKGSKVPQNAKVVHFLVGKVDVETDEPGEQTTFIQLANKTVTVKLPTLKEPMQKALAKIKELQSAGFSVTGAGNSNYRVINKTPMWIKKDDYANAITLINKDIFENFTLSDGKKIENFIAPADPALAKGASAGN